MSRRKNIYNFSYLTLTLVKLWAQPQLQEEIYFLIISSGRSFAVSTYLFCIYWWRASFQKCFWRTWKRRIRNILVEARAYFDKQGSLYTLGYFQALAILEVKSMKSLMVYTNIVTYIDRIDCFGFIYKNWYKCTYLFFIWVLYFYFQEI